MESKRLELLERIKIAMDEIATEELLDLRQRMSIPFPPASSPGEYPHTRTGTLLASTEVQISGGLEDPQFSIGATAPYAQAVNATRPFIDMQFNRLQGTFEERMRSKLEGST